MISLNEIEKYSKGITILYVEDDDEVRESTNNFLSTIVHDITLARDGKEALDIYKSREFDVVISDINMPIMNGVKLSQEIKKINNEQAIIIISAHDDPSYLLDLINIGVDNFVLKPFDINKFLFALYKSIKTITLSRAEKNQKLIMEETIKKRTLELTLALEKVNNLSIEVVQKLSSAAELRDTDTGKHILRLGLYSEKQSQLLGLDPHFVESIKFAATLHDIGKIGISDNILLKQGPLTKEEFELMKTHCEIGARILSGSNNEKLRMAEIITLAHHEKWDGSGYPNNLSGENIPLEGRIVTICDQYDALRSIRPYKKSFSHFDVINILTNGDSRTTPDHFDQYILKYFLKYSDYFDKIFLDNQE